MFVSLIITTYNWPQSLALVLRSAVAQTRLPDEIIIADDGSGPETSHVVQGILNSSGLRWGHVRHADQGVRQSRIKNLAVKHSEGDYLIFVDHDVVLHPRFVEDHVSMAQEGCFLQGKRLLLSACLTEEILARGLFMWPKPWSRGVGNRKNLFRLPLLGRWVSREKRFERSLRGCNLSMFRDDFLKVDGFDEIFDGSWGREDSDICYRLFHSGSSIKTLWFLGLQCHLHHRTASWDRERLDGELERNLKEKRVRALRGFSSLSSEGDLIANSPSLRSFGG